MLALGGTAIAIQQNTAGPALPANTEGPALAATTTAPGLEGEFNMGHASVPAGSRRYLSQTPSVPEADVDLVRLQSVQKKLKSTELRGLDGLGALAKEHAAASNQLLGSGGRTLVPNFKVRVATACSGSAADRVSMAAVKAAVSPVCPDFDFEYVFNCEIKPNKPIGFLHSTTRWKISNRLPPLALMEDTQQSLACLKTSKS